jgi:long-chain acyl-CoA synthetase
MVDPYRLQKSKALRDSDDIQEKYNGYMPQAHILDLAADIFFFTGGHMVGYADPKSLLGGPERCYPRGGLEEFKPSLMAGVPKVWETIKAGASKKLDAAGAVAKFLVNLTINQKARAAYYHRPTPLLAAVFLKNFKALTGGKLKACLSGGGSISAEVQEWIRTALDAPLVQGYGLTETCAGATVQMPDDMSIGIAGTPLSSIEITLHSEPEITDLNGNAYLATDTIHSTGEPCAGRGEVWLRGTNVTLGYYKMPKETAAEFDKDGWFHTGDIGLLTPGGALKIIDRKKNLVKLKGGEYVALEKMNLAYNNSYFVDVEKGGVCCLGDHTLDKPVCVAQCKLTELQKVAESAGLKHSDPAELCANEKVQEEVLKSFKVEAKKAGLTNLETVVGVYPIVEPWSAENGCLTASQKIVPKKIYAMHDKEFSIIKKKGGAK